MASSPSGDLPGNTQPGLVVNRARHDLHGRATCLPIRCATSGPDGRTCGTSRWPPSIKCEAGGWLRGNAVSCRSAESRKGLCPDVWNDRPYSDCEPFDAASIPRYAASLSGTADLEPTIY
jgi:hypothetical protein